jgi:hypothetical protein
MPNMFMSIWVGGHWISISNIFVDIDFTPNHFNIYDSLFNISYLRSLSKLFDLLCDLANSTVIIINRIEVAKHNGFNDCGLFTLAYCYDLCENQLQLACHDPSQFIYSQDQTGPNELNCMRAHFNSCIAAKAFTSFPSSSRHENQEKALSNMKYGFNMSKNPLDQIPKQRLTYTKGSSKLVSLDFN